ncbi:hypothetical protein TWF102_007405 [Orbilia oligospora]|uniref:SAP domain-containing protein n=1 Tax=Orbilia oligospora TaxID=2813651 RepID=A0A7C8N3A9_ORBOL|nr:hypothetical protein TWF102_007405 [Orbilia oligospora]KAF3098063.1 hypothetical protein TWF103_009163 [Orbilia oligospora]KAF3139409.1 hypothetical protein TWF594_006699 [Orbilia oligospora]KAF3145157.1 hypothetical protein TWF703_007741 [Orbilia oligospora]
MTDYNKLKVADLKEQLALRGLPLIGKKDELVSRLVADDATKASNPPNGESSSEPAKEEAPVVASVTSATETPVEQHDTKTDTTAPSESVPEPASAAPIEGEKKKFAFKRLADEFEAPAPNEVAKPEQPKAPEPVESFTAGLATTNTDSELEKRKKRAARFGVPVTDSIKLAERAKRFAADGDDSNKDTTIKALDSALGENKGKKRAPETRIQNEPPKKSKDSPKPAVTGVLADPSEKAKAEARAKRFG